jgi:CRP/FNR family transcriptional regulator
MILGGHTYAKGLEILRSFSPFSALPEEVLQRLLKGTDEVAYTRGDIIVSEDQQCQHLHLVVSGAVKIYKLSEDGRERIIHVMKSGSFFGEDIVFSGDRYEASAEALSETILYNIKKAALEALVLEYPPFALALLASFGRRLKRLMMLIGEAALSDVRKRLCRVLLELAEEEGKGNSGGPLIQVRHAVLAARVGTVRETLCRVLGQLEGEGLITRKGRGIVILNISSLQAEVPHWRQELQLFPLEPNTFRQK